MKKEIETINEKIGRRCRNNYMNQVNYVERKQVTKMRKREGQEEI